MATQPKRETMPWCPLGRTQYSVLWQSCPAQHGLPANGPLGMRSRALEVLEHEHPAPAPAPGQVGGPGPRRDLGPQLGRLDQRKIGHGIAPRSAAIIAPPRSPSGSPAAASGPPDNKGPASAGFLASGAITPNHRKRESPFMPMNGKVARPGAPELGRAISGDDRGPPVPKVADRRTRAVLCSRRRNFPVVLSFAACPVVATFRSKHPRPSPARG